MGVMVNMFLVFLCTECFLVLGVIIVIYEFRVLPKCAIISDITTATRADKSSFLFLSNSIPWPRPLALSLVPRPGRRSS